MPTWLSLPKLFPELDMWGYAGKRGTFVISFDHDEHEWFATVRPYKGAMQRLGVFDNRDAAERACTEFDSHSH